jgi:hypothetical protein
MANKLLGQLHYCLTEPIGYDEDSLGAQRQNPNEQPLDALPAWGV